MQTRIALEALMTRQLLARGLGRAEGQLAFVHDSQAISVAVDATIYRGYFIAVLDAGVKVHEFRPQRGAFDWDAIAASIIRLARLSRERRSMPPMGNELEAIAGSPIDELWQIVGAGLSLRMAGDPMADGRPRPWKKT